MLLGCLLSYLYIDSVKHCEGPQFKPVPAASVQLLDTFTSSAAAGAGAGTIKGRGGSKFGGSTKRASMKKVKEEDFVPAFPGSLKINSP